MRLFLLSFHPLRVGAAVTDRRTFSFRPGGESADPPSQSQNRSQTAASAVTELKMKVR